MVGMEPFEISAAVTWLLIESEAKDEPPLTGTLDMIMYIRESDVGAMNRELLLGMYFTQQSRRC